MEDVFVTEEISSGGSSEEGNLETARRRDNRDGFEMHMDAVSPYREMYLASLGQEPAEHRVETVDSSSEDEESIAAAAEDAKEQLNMSQLSTMFESLAWQEVESINVEAPNLQERLQQLCEETRRKAAGLETGEESPQAAAAAASSRASSVGSRTVRGQPIQSEVAFRQQTHQIAMETTGTPAPPELPVETSNDLDPHQRAT
ncbi:MAG: hypothetical protein GY772_24020, partial [bacterium]|nr:hypothetical protein [bacterium]